MKRDEIIYWITTGLVAAGMLYSSAMYLMENPELIQGFQYLGYPLFIVTLLGIAKFLGGLALITPVPAQVKEWAYAGFTFTFIGALWTHLATGTSWIAPVVFMLLLAMSYYFRLRLR